MARLNIEECWWSDPRRDLLRRLLGTETQDQVAIHAWRLAQEFWSKGMLIPGETFLTLTGAMPLIKARLAKIHEGPERDSNEIRTTPELTETDIERVFIYVKGSCDYLSWLSSHRQQRVEAGRKSAEKRRAKYGSAQPISNETRTTVRTESNALEVSVSGSVSGSRKNNTKGENFENSVVPINTGLKVLDKPTRQPNLDIPKFIGAYVKAYQSVFGETTRPAINGKVQGQIKSFLKDYPIERACELIQVYCQMNDPWFKTKCYDFGTFLQNLNKVSLARDTGSDSEIEKNKINWSKIDLK